ncbi:MAG: hypothetical protein NVS3B16_03470 [Vulcanimicrobiaceae bacterium]
MCAIAAPAPSPSPLSSPAASPAASLGGEPDLQLHADVRADSLKYRVVPKHAGATVSGVNARGRSSTVTNVASPKPGTTYRNVHAVFDASARFVAPQPAASAVPKTRATP